ncbi:MAG: NFYB/HAP3 family transcription factor subunit [Candidatus Aenigmatarchaeota archaeon]
MTFSAAPFERILKKAGAKRVSKGAMEEFARIMEEKVYEVAKEAALLARHAGRKTILGEDVIAAKKKFLS